jgi:hypothetical protein
VNVFSIVEILESTDCGPIGYDAVLERFNLFSDRIVSVVAENLPFDVLEIVR